MQPARLALLEPLALRVRLGRLELKVQQVLLDFYLRMANSQYLMALLQFH